MEDANKMKTTQRAQHVIETGDTTQPQMKKMMLELPIDIHSWIRTIAEATQMTQPHVVLMALADVTKTPTKHYVDRLEQAKAQKRASDIAEQLRALKAEYEALQTKLS
jgi:hypothetical protein